MHNNNSSVEGAIAAMGVFGFLIAVAIIVFLVVIYWKIATKAGYNGALSLLLFVPLVNVLLIVLFAFSKWPIEVALERARGAPGSYPAVVD